MGVAATPCPHGPPVYQDLPRVRYLGNPFPTPIVLQAIPCGIRASDSLREIPHEQP